MAEAKKMSGLSDRKYVLVDILVKQFVDRQTGQEKPYYEIWVKSVTENRIIKFKPANGLEFAEKMKEYQALLGKQVGLVIDAKEFDGKLLAVIADILPIL